MEYLIRANLRNTVYVSIFIHCYYDFNRKKQKYKGKKTFSYVRLVHIVLDGISITSKLCKIAVEPVLLETIYQKFNVSTLKCECKIN